MIGIDITSVDRIKRMYEKFGIRAYEKFLNPKEIELVKKPETFDGFLLNLECHLDGYD